LGERIRHAGQSHLILGTGSTGYIITSQLPKLCYAEYLYRPLESLDAIALTRHGVHLTF